VIGEQLPVAARATLDPEARVSRAGWQSASGSSAEAARLGGEGRCLGGPGWRRENNSLFTILGEGEEGI
jgi:hypothetical protein